MPVPRGWRSTGPCSDLRANRTARTVRNDAARPPVRPGPDPDSGACLAFACRCRAGGVQLGPVPISERTGLPGRCGMTLLAHRYALDPTPTQERALRSHAGAARVAFNWALFRSQSEPDCPDGAE